MEREEIERSFKYNMTNAFIKGWYEKNHERYTEEIEDVFYEGAEAAQKYFIEKATEWLWNNFYEHPHERWLICSESFDTIEYMIERFKAAMEE